MEVKWEKWNKYCRVCKKSRNGQITGDWDMRLRSEN